MPGSRTGLEPRSGGKPVAVQPIVRSYFANAGARAIQKTYARKQDTRNC